MIDLQKIRKYKDTVIERLQKRGVPNIKEQIEALCALDVAKRLTQTQLDTATAALNKRSKAIGEALQNQQATEQIHTEKQAIHALKEEIKVLAHQYKAYESELLEKLYQLPNIPHEAVPIGTHAADNETVYQSPTLPLPPSDALAHWDLIKKYDLIDFEWGNKITGAGFPVYKGKGAKLQRALIHFFLEKATEAGYLEIQPPILVHEISAYATGQLPDKEGQMYALATGGLYLIPTAEVPLTNLYRNCIVSEEDLPIKLAGYTPCFRREAGSWGADVRGLNRLHQFDKVELVQICHPTDSYRQLEEMVAHVQDLLTQLELPYRILKLCTGDLGFCAAMTYDLEVFSVAQNKWLEVSSVSNFETFQSNRLALRYKDKDKKSHLLHTLNGSALALPRVLAALLELNQTKEGIVVPKVLQPYTGFSIL
ncbi:MAG TPA: serine--tRNA ligase [Amoebophilaceae bacterium]|jgi:seryl-tRNA synthetase|nr:serine--tRNA ligase [Amoebophilaceae bacterium]